MICVSSGLGINTVRAGLRVRSARQYRMDSDGAYQRAIDLKTAQRNTAEARRPSKVDVRRRIVVRLRIVVVAWLILAMAWIIAGVGQTGVLVSNTRLSIGVRLYRGGVDVKVDILEGEQSKYWRATWFSPIQAERRSRPMWLWKPQMEVIVSPTGRRYRVMMPLWLVMIPSTVLVAWCGLTRSRRTGECLGCGYSRVGLPDSVPCPECGANRGPRWGTGRVAERID